MRSVFVIALLCIALIAYGESGGKPQPRSGGLRYDAKSNQEGMQRVPVFVEAEVTTSQSKGDADRNAKEEREKAEREWTAIKISVVGAGIAFAAMIIAIIQLGFFRRQLRIMRDTVTDTSKAASSAEATAKATKAMADQAADTARKELRAYMSIKEKGIRLLPNGIYQTYVLFTNSGKTPAKDVRIFLDYDIQDNGYTGPFEIQERPSGFPLGPGHDHIVRAVMPKLANEDIRRIANDREIFVWGRVDYLDIYGESNYINFRFHTRETIQEIVVRHAPAHIAESRITGWALQPTTEGNDES